MFRALFGANVCGLLDPLFPCFAGHAGVVDGGIRTGKDSLLIYLGGTMSTPWKELTVGAAYDYVSHDYVYGGNHAQAVALYASFQATEKLKFNNRIEYATVSGILATDSADSIDGGEGGTGGIPTNNRVKIIADTFTADYALWANVVTRLEFRWDHGANRNTTFGGQRNDISVAANVIYKF